MEMWRKESTLLLLTVAVMVISAQDPVILDKTQRRVVLPSGSSPTLRCSLTTEKHDRFRVFLYFNPSGSSFNVSHKISERIFFRFTNTSTMVYNKNQDMKNGGIQSEERVLQYTLLNATAAQSGWYFCKVTAEIPDFLNENSNGTEVIFVTLPPTGSVQLVDWWLWMLLGVSAFILFVLLVICIWMRRRYRGRREADPIYANTRPVAQKQPSPRPGTPGENLKKVSASQNLRDPSRAGRYEHGKRKQRR
uniref:T-cell-specific surface glycoprotein CD28 homolog isoform X2 n=1 Tax=Semicossyphus pulcher TaxID=241346 RepID=UPI0037E7C430